MNSLKKISGLYAICDNSFSPQYSHFELARSFARGGASIIQLRMKNEKNLKEVEKISRSILELKNEFQFTFILNDYLEVAIELEVDGIHVGKEDPDPFICREKLGPKKLIGYSSHSIEEAIAVEKSGVDYVAFGAIFPTKTKGPGHPVQGIEKLKELIKKVSIPVVAIGGINSKNITSVLETGVSSVAMITALTQAKNVEEATRFFTYPETLFQ